jgi:predicted AAA+ superfamily ATPase
MSNEAGVPRVQSETLVQRLLDERRFVVVIGGPRQVGKTTMVRQALSRVGVPWLYVTADGPTPPDAAWLHAQWDAATLLTRGPAVLVVDEAQKIPGWAEVVKARWDADTAAGSGLRVVLLGSSPLLVRRGLTESLAGRFELLRMTHWNLGEMQQLAGWDVDRYVLFGGYPGAASLAVDPRRWGAYVRDSLIETTVSRDVLMMARVEKPALLRQLFGLACRYTGQELSFTKMLGQLQDAGNTVTLAHYLDLLDDAGLVTGLRKFAGDVARQRGSSPKLLVRNTALYTATSGLDPDRIRNDPERWGRLVESAVGAHLVNTAPDDDVAVTWWRDGRHEVDFVLQRGPDVTAVEVKTTIGAPTPGLTEFRRRWPAARGVVVGPGGVSLTDWFARPAAAWLG